MNEQARRAACTGRYGARWMVGIAPCLAAQAKHCCRCHDRMSGKYDDLHSAISRAKLRDASPETSITPPSRIETDPRGYSWGSGGSSQDRNQSASACGGCATAGSPRDGPAHRPIAHLQAWPKDRSPAVAGAPGGPSGTFRAPPHACCWRSGEQRICAAPMLSSYADHLERLRTEGRRRTLVARKGMDFSSNDYLAMAGDRQLRGMVLEALERGVPIGSGGSRLLRGNHPEHEELE